MARPRRRRGVVGPGWAPNPVDVAPEQVRVLPGWVMVEEQLEVGREYEVEGQSSLVIPRYYDRHTVYGRVRGIHSDTARELGVTVGDEVVYREWEGGRWDLRGQMVLIMPSYAVLARREADV